MSVYAWNRIFNVKRFSPAGVKNIVTKDAKPSGPPEDLSGATTSSTSVTVRWKRPKEFSRNGKIVTYSIVYYKKGTSSATMNGTMNGIPPSVDEYTEKEITGLDSFTEYVIDVTAVTSIDRGPEATISLKTYLPKPLIESDDSTALERSTCLSMGLNGSCTELSISWEENDDASKYIAYYSISDDDESWAIGGSFNDKNESFVTSAANNVVFEGLRANVKYNYGVIGVSASQPSNFSLEIVNDDNLASKEVAQTRTITTASAAPTAAPRDLKIVKTTDDSVTLKWKSPQRTYWNGDPKLYKVKWRIINNTYHDLKKEDESEVDFMVDGQQNPDEYIEREVDGLEAAVEYSFKVSMMVKDVATLGPDSDDVKGRTLNDIPEASPQIETPSYESPTKVTLHWLVPRNVYDINGDITGYQVTLSTEAKYLSRAEYQLESSTEVISPRKTQKKVPDGTVEVQNLDGKWVDLVQSKEADGSYTYTYTIKDGSTQSATFRNLMAGTKYSYTVAAATDMLLKDKFGVKSSLSDFDTKSGAPNAPLAPAVSSGTATETYTSFTVSWLDFDDEWGRIEKVWVVVQKKKLENPTPACRVKPKNNYFTESDCGGECVACPNGAVGISEGANKFYDGDRKYRFAIYPTLHLAGI